MQVYSYEDGEEVEPSHKLTHSCGESVTSVEGGVASAPGYEEVVAATYTGNLFALSSVPSGSAASAGARRLNTDTCARLAKLKTEIDELQVTDKTNAKSIRFTTNKRKIL